MSEPGQDKTIGGKCAFIALVGAPNAGKSTLLNQQVGAKVSIVTHKVQTTRTQIRGIAIDGDTQLVFIDTPGIFAPRRRLERAMVDAAWSGARDADIVVVIVDAKRGGDADTDRIIAGLKGFAKDGPARTMAARPIALVLNKIDLVPRESLLALSAELNETGLFTETFMISALNGNGVPDFHAFLLAHAPLGPWHYAEDQLSDLPQRVLAADVTREKAFELLHQELPYALAVDTVDWQERDDGGVRIEQTIYIERDSQKGIVIGKGGQSIKRIRERAQADLTAMLDRPVHLFIQVKVSENWVNDPFRYREWGLKFDA